MRLLFLWQTIKVEKLTCGEIHIWQWCYLLNSFDSNGNSVRTELNSILEKKSQKGNKIFVMSNERLSGKPHSSGFDSFIIARRIKSIFPKGKMFLMIREQKTFLLSNYFQYLSCGGTFVLYSGRKTF